jgi:PKD repeat protein
MICAYSCGTGNQGGCNSAEQVVAYFLNQFGGSLYYYYTQYNCWAGSTLAVSQGGNCCPSAPPTSPVAAISASDTNTCAGECVTFSSASSGDPTQWAWQFSGASVASSALEDPGVICFNQPGNWSVSLTASNALGSSVSTITINVQQCAVSGCMYPQAVNYNPQATVDDLSCTFLCGNNCPADLDTNGVVGVSDLLLFIAVFGNTCPN